MIIIRYADISDYEQINNLSYELYYMHHQNRPDVFNNTNICFSEELYKKELEDDKTRIYVALNNHEIVAYIYLKHIVQKQSLLCKEREIISIYDFVVSKNYQNQGIGKILHKYIIDYANEVNCKIIELDVWEFNTSAIEFYKKLGYVNKNRKMELFL